MKKLIVLTLILGFANTLFAAWGFHDDFRSYVQFHEKKGATVETNTYSLWNAAAGTFENHDFGIFNPGNGDEFVMLLYDTKTFKNDGSDVNGCEYFYTRYEKGNRPGSVSFTSLGGGWLEDLGSDNQKWGVASMTVNMLSGLSIITNTLEIYGQVTGTNPDETQYDNNNSAPANYSSTFLIIPEPTSIFLIFLGLGFLRFRK